MTAGKRLGEQLIFRAFYGGNQTACAVPKRRFDTFGQSFFSVGFDDDSVHYSFDRVFFALVERFDFIASYPLAIDS